MPPGKMISSIYCVFCVIFSVQAAAQQSNQTTSALRNETASVESSMSSTDSSVASTESTTAAGAGTSDQMRNKDYTGECFLDRNDMCNDHGVCTYRAHNQTTYCKCEEKFAGHDCSQKRRAKWHAFLLAFFLGSFGAGRFYMGYIGLGVFKLLLCSGGCCIGIFCVFGGAAIMASDKHERIGAVCGAVGILAICMAALGATAWWVADWALILADSLPDAQGFALYSGW